MHNLISNQNIQFKSYLSFASCDGLEQGRANTYLNWPKRTIVIMLGAGPFRTKQKQLVLFNPRIVKIFFQTVYTYHL